MQTIVTKYFGPRNVHDSRIMARATSGERLTLPWNDALNSDCNHRCAALALALRLSWRGDWACGTLSDSGDRVWVCYSKASAEEKFVMRV